MRGTLLNGYIARRSQSGRFWVHAITWLLIVALFNLTLIPIHGFAAKQSNGDLEQTTICSVQGLQPAVQKADSGPESPVAPKGPEQTWTCALCILHGGAILPFAPSFLESRAVRYTEAQFATSCISIPARPPFLDGPHSQAPPLA
jgi:Protein of unknown function (DUF2946)